MDERSKAGGGDPGRAGPMDPTRKLLKVFGVKVTDYEAKTDDLLTQPVREIRAELERFGLDRRAIALVRRGPAREELIGLRLIVRDLDPEHLEQLAGGIHRARST